MSPRWAKEKSSWKEEKTCPSLAEGFSARLGLRPFFHSAQNEKSGENDPKFLFLFLMKCFNKNDSIMYLEIYFVLQLFIKMTLKLIIIMRQA